MTRSASDSTRSVGRAAEDIAARHLERAGLRILARNYRCRAGELDLVAVEGSELVFVEVRHRRSAAYGGAAASVVRRKQQRIASCAAHFLQAHHIPAARACRFDVVALTGAISDPVVEWIRDAFQA